MLGEQIAQAYADHSVETVVLRPSWVYGPRRRTTCVIKTMITDALANQPTHLPYGAGFPRQFVHVTDAAEAVAAALTTSRGAQSATTSPTEVATCWTNWQSSCVSACPLR